jgi:hypothetical protein
VGPRAGLDAGARRKICPCRGSNLDRPIVQPVVRHDTASATADIYIYIYMYTHTYIKLPCESNHNFVTNTTSFSTQVISKALCPPVLSSIPGSLHETDENWKFFTVYMPRKRLKISFILDSTFLNRNSRLKLY